MINKEIGQIVEEDLQGLIKNAVREGRDIEYKQELPSDSDAAKIEFLADVSSFANAVGGDLLIGIIEDKGEPKDVRGVPIEDADKQIQRLDNIIREGLSPRIPLLEIKPVELKNSKYVFILRISQSWISPHRVVYRGHDRFYSRNSSGKYPLDVNELRAAFNLTETVRDHILNFKADRISKIIAGETFVPGGFENPKIVLHLIPLVSFSRLPYFEIEKVTNDHNIIHAKMRPLASSVSDSSYNFDGFITYRERTGGKASAYFQLFRSGIIETVNAQMIRSDEKRLVIPSLTFESEIIVIVPRYLELYKVINVAMPMFLFLTLIGVKGYKMAYSGLNDFIHNRPAIDRDILQAPEIIIQNYEVKAEGILKPCFDSIWNASGFPGSPYYDENSERRTRP